MRKFRMLSLLLAVLMSVSVLTACNNGTTNATTTAAGATTKSNATTAAPGGTTAATAAAVPTELKVCVGPEPDSIDPAYNEAVDGATMLIHAFAGITKLDKNGVPQPDMAKEVKVSTDLLTYTITLRDGLKWSDGKALVAQDFIYAWQRAIDPKNATTYGYMLGNIKGVNDIIAAKPDSKYDLNSIGAKATDDKTIVITLDAPTSYFMEILAFPTLFPVRKDIVEGNDKWATDPKTYISNGPYRMKSWVTKSEIVFEKNPNYYDAKSIGPDTIRFVLMDDDNAILAAFKSGGIMFADSFPNDEIDALRSTPEFNLASQLGTYYVGFNCTKAPFDNVKVRQALSLAIDRNFIVEKIGKAGQLPAGAYVPVGMTDGDPTKEFRTVGGDYYSVKAADYAANVTKAKALLSEAGYPDGKGFPKFEYMFNTSTGNKLIAEALQNMWKTTLGVDCTLVEQEWGVFLTTRQNGAYQVARNGWLADYNDPITFLDMWVTGGGNNDSKWSNKDYDALIAGVKASGDRIKRYADMHKAEDILMKEAPVAPIYYYVDLYLKSTKLNGFYTSPLGFKYFMYTSIAK
ncbi:MAG TPA: peptide ABC transporter substrate-binding protein [Clostridia bacterium]